jgi:hypothetical protein
MKERKKSSSFTKDASLTQMWRTRYAICETLTQFFLRDDALLLVRKVSVNLLHLVDELHEDVGDILKEKGVII